MKIIVKYVFLSFNKSNLVYVILVKVLVNMNKYTFNGFNRIICLRYISVNEAMKPNNCLDLQ